MTDESDTADFIRYQVNVKRANAMGTSTLSWLGICMQLIELELVW